ncbi:MAG: dipeptidase [Bacteroidetes bacterium CG02_land_8_20_14_3_00_31_25]|nr:MAG: dipeptidase [Bacteroidetes bacterium CG02_land_8_20_14_3_00_31_25]
MKIYLIITIAIGLFITQDAISCTNLLISKGATTDGSTMISYNADSHVLYGELYYRPAADYPEGSWFDIYEWDTGKYLGKIKQVKHTYSVVGNMNENQVSIGETTYGGRLELIDTTAIVDYGSLMYITLQRAKTAREAIKIFSELINEYGYYSEGESFSIADANEVWILEMIGKGSPKKDAKGKIDYSKGAVWVAILIPDGYISGHANHARITTFPFQKKNNFFDPKQTVFHSPDVISFARKMGYYKGEDKAFSFSDVYAPLDFEAARFCEARVWAQFNRVNKDMAKYEQYAMGYDLINRMPLYIKPDKKLSVHDVIELMRDYYQGTKMDMTKDFGAGSYSCIVRWRPLTWKVDSTEYFNERAVSTQQTGFTFVAQSRSWLPNPIGGIFWFGVDDTYSNVYSPMYCGITKVPETYAVGNGSMMVFSDNSAFWAFNQVSNFAYTRYSDIIKEIQPVQRELETKYIETIPNIDKEASELYKKNPAKALEYITNYSVNTGNETVKRWKQLYGFLFTKYMDGNIKTTIPGQRNPKVSQLGYSNEFYREIVRQTGDKFKVPAEQKH